MILTISNDSKSHETYYLARIRTVNDTTVKVQIETKQLNRSYGAMFLVDCTKQMWVVQWIENAMKDDAITKCGSLYGDSSNEKYIYARIRCVPNTMKIRCQVRGFPSYNRPYGIAFDIYQLGLYKSLTTHIDEWYGELVRSIIT